MARTKDIKDEKDVRPFWKKTGGGMFHFKGERIKRNQKFQAFEHEIPKAFRDTIVLADETSPIVEKKKEPTIKKKANGWYDVFDAKGVQINIRALRKKDAEDLLAALKDAKK